jgi:hypothetical protein
MFMLDVSDDKNAAHQAISAMTFHTVALYWLHTSLYQCETLASSFESVLGVFLILQTRCEGTYKKEAT